MASWKVELVIAVGIFAAIGLLVAVWVHTPSSVSLPSTSTSTSTSTNLLPDVRVTYEKGETTSDVIFTIHYMVYGGVANFGNATSGPVTVHLEIQRTDGVSLLETNATTIPATLDPKQDGKFTFLFSSDDLGGDKSSDWRYGVTVVKQ
jgi:hypothetical protein